MLILLVASIPVAMPAVFSITMALGALALSKQKAIVSRLAAIEEMAGVDILCTDKTGTLTKNQLKLGDPILLAATDPEDVVLAGALASRLEDHDPIDTCVIEGLKDPNATKPWTHEAFTPFDPVTKRTEATVKDAQGKELTVAKGAPQAIVDLDEAAGRRRAEGQGHRRRARRQGQPRARRRPLRGRRQDLVAARHPADVRPAAR